MATVADRARQWSLGLVLGIGLLLRLGFLAGADEAALVRIVPDDAYYYFKLARNVVAGHGATFDELHRTNGYHPLWMGVLLPVAAVVRDPLLFVRVTLVLGVALSFLAAILLHRLVRRMTDCWWVPLLALILYWLNPKAVVSSLNGLETSLSTLLFTVLLGITLRIADCGLRIADFNPKSEIRNPKWLSLVLGLLMGILFLARTDNVFFIGVFWLAATAMAERGERLRRAAAMAVAAAILAVPWVAYNWLAFGSPVQVSGLSIPYVKHALYRAEEHGGLSPVLYGLKQFAVVLYEGLRGEIGYSRLVSFPAVALALLISMTHWRKEPGARRAIMVLLGLGLASLAHLFVHSAIRWYPRPWYFDQLLVLLPAVFALALAMLASGRGFLISDFRFSISFTRAPNTEHRTPSLVSPHWLSALLAVGLALIVAFQTVQSVRLLARGEWPWAVEMLDAARWLRDNTGRDDVAAAFNAGIIGYCSGRRVVNLDGAVNNAAYDALRRKNLMGLMRKAKVAHYLDFEPRTLDEFRPFLGPLAEWCRMRLLTLLARPGADWEGSHIQVLALDWQQEGTKED